MSLIARQAVPVNTPESGSADENGASSASPDGNSNTSSTSTNTNNTTTSTSSSGGYVTLALAAVVALILLYFILRVFKRHKARKAQAELLNHTGTSFSLQDINLMSGLKSTGPRRFDLGRVMCM